jgi:hypothetical protein
MFPIQCITRFTLSTSAIHTNRNSSFPTPTRVIRQDSQNKRTTLVQQCFRARILSSHMSSRSTITWQSLLERHVDYRRLEAPFCKGWNRCGRSIIVFVSLVPLGEAYINDPELLRRDRASHLSRNRKGDQTRRGMSGDREDDRKFSICTAGYAPISGEH